MKSVKNKDIVIYDTDNIMDEDFAIELWSYDNKDSKEEITEEDINDIIVTDYDQNYSDFVDQITEPENFGGLLLFGEFGAWNGGQYGAKFFNIAPLKESIERIMATNYESSSKLIYNKDSFGIKLIQSHHDGTNVYYLVMIKKQSVEKVYNMVKQQLIFNKDNLKGKVYADKIMFNCLMGVQ